MRPGAPGGPSAWRASLSRTGTFLQMQEYSGDGELSDNTDVVFLETADGAVAVYGPSLDPDKLQTLVDGKDAAGAISTLQEAGYRSGSARRPEGVRELDSGPRGGSHRRLAAPELG